MYVCLCTCTCSSTLASQRFSRLGCCLPALARYMTIHVVYGNRDWIPESYTADPTRRHDRCTHCNRPRQIWANIHGWCERCLQWYFRNGADYILRCLERQGYARLAVIGVCTLPIPFCSRALVLDYMAGSTRERQLWINQTVWKSILLGFCEDIESRVVYCKRQWAA